MRGVGHASRSEAVPKWLCDRIPLGIKVPPNPFLIMLVIQIIFGWLNRCDCPILWKRLRLMQFPDVLRAGNDCANRFGETFLSWFQRIIKTHVYGRGPSWQGRPTTSPQTTINNHLLEPWAPAGENHAGVLSYGSGPIDEVGRGPGMGSAKMISQCVYFVFIYR